LIIKQLNKSVSTSETQPVADVQLQDGAAKSVRVIDQGEQER
jgi:hypothetical protein